jgi:hypothetical protein
VQPASDLDERLLVVQEVIRQVLDGVPVVTLPGLAAGVERVLFGVVLRLGAVEVIPGTEVMELATDPLAPLAGRVECQWVVRSGLLWFASGAVGSRIVSGHGNGSAQQALLWSRPGASQPLPALLESSALVVLSIVRRILGESGIDVTS